jgi:hypothetical protein
MFRVTSKGKPMITLATLQLIYAVSGINTASMVSMIECVDRRQNQHEARICKKSNPCQWTPLADDVVVGACTQELVGEAHPNGKPKRIVLVHDGYKLEEIQAGRITD